jgi:DMSO reductase anchor subunit
MLKEWPLVAFTLLGQTAVGVLLSFGVPWVLTMERFVLTPQEGAFLSSSLALVMGLLAAASLLSFFHLHHPLRAYRALANLRTSWLSREILFELTTIALVGLEIVLMRTMAAPLWVHKGVMGAACFSGLAFLLSMIKLYRLPAVPAWNRIATHFSFINASIILGLMTASLVWRIHFSHYSDPARRWLALVFFAVCYEIVTVFVSDLSRSREVRTLGPSLRPPAASLKGLAYGRLIALVAGLVALVAFSIRVTLINEEGRFSFVDPPGYGLGPLGLQVAALVILAAAEAMGRFHFYGLVPRPGGPDE